MNNTRTRQLRDEFDAAHTQGTNAFYAGDFEAAREAVRVERDMIEKQAVRIAERRKEIASLRPVPTLENNEDQRKAHGHSC